MANESNNNLGGGGTLNLNRLLSERRQLLVDPAKNQGFLDQNWRKIQRTAPSSRGQIANLPRWERTALENSLATQTPQSLDGVIGKSAAKNAAADELKNLWGGGATHGGGRGPWDDFGLGDGHTMNSLDEESGEPEGQQQQDDGRTPEEKPEEEVADDGGENDNEKPDEPEKGPNESKPEEGEEPPMGADADAKPPKGEGAASEGAADAAKAAKGLGEASEVAEGAGALAEGAGAAGAAAAGAAGVEAAAAETAAASVVVVESNPMGWVLTIAAVLAVFIIAIVGLTAMEYAYPSPAKAIVPPTPSLPTGNAAGLMAKACEFKNSKAEYDKARPGGLDWTDCWGFVSTSLRFGADSDFRRTTIARFAPTAIDKHDKDKHGGTKYDIFPFTSTRKLNPGDMLFITRGFSSSGNRASHAGLYIGKNYCGCSGANITLQASLYSHGPKCDNMANRWDTVVRIVK